MDASMAPNDPTPLLIRKAQEGDRAAFDELASRFATRLEAVIESRLGRGGEARGVSRKRASQVWP